MGNYGYWKIFRREWREAQMLAGENRGKWRYRMAVLHKQSPWRAGGSWPWKGTKEPWNDSAGMAGMDGPQWKNGNGLVRGREEAQHRQAGQKGGSLAVLYSKPTSQEKVLRVLYGTAKDELTLILGGAWINASWSVVVVGTFHTDCVEEQEGSSWTRDRKEKSWSGGQWERGERKKGGGERRARLLWSFQCWAEAIHSRLF